jgi:GT2 family glycosyltransferase
VLATLDRLRRLVPPPAIVVVDNGSHDGTAAAIRDRWPDVTVVALRANRGAAARNVGVRMARTPYVALCDDDTWWAPGALEAAADVLDACPDVAVVTARIAVGPDARLDPASAAMAASPLDTPCGTPGRRVLGFMAGACMVRRDAFLDVGGFEPRLFLGGEEHLLALDLASRGWTMLYVPAVVVHHHPSPQRNVAARRRLLVRNALWSAWLRRPVAGALRQTLRLLARNPYDALTLRAALEAAAGARWVMARRRVVPAPVEAALRRLEADA